MVFELFVVVIQPTLIRKSWTTPESPIFELQQGEIWHVLSLSNHNSIGKHSNTLTGWRLLLVVVYAFQLRVKCVYFYVNKQIEGNDELKRRGQKNVTTEHCGYDVLFVILFLLIVIT